MRACDDNFRGYLRPKCAIGFNRDDDLHGQGDNPGERTTYLIARQHGRFSGVQIEKIEIFSTLSTTDADTDNPSDRG